MTDFEEALIQTARGTVIAIDVSASSSRDLFPDGYNEWRRAIKCSIKAPPVEGRANKAVIALMAHVISVPKSRISIISGQTSTQKRVLIEGMDAGETRSRLLEFFR